MNVFALHSNPKMAAVYHCDKHVVKMILESAQILSTVHQISPGEHSEKIASNLYRQTHQRHPCVLWALQSQGNYDWLVQLSFALNAEFRYRYGKTVDHASVRVLNAVKSTYPSFGEVNPALRPFALTMPAEARLRGDGNHSIQEAVDSYRNYYRLEKRAIAQWTGRPKPHWWY